MDSENQAEKKRKDDRRGNQDRKDTVDRGVVPDGHTAQFVGSHRVIFPGEPYNVQLPLMERVLRALDANSNALIEAPTGVGKTVALLCASMQWLEDHNINKQSKFVEALATERSTAACTKDQFLNKDQSLTKDQSFNKDPVSMGNELWRFSYTSPGKRRGPAPDSTKVELVSSNSRKKSSRLPLGGAEDLELQHSGKKQKCELEPKPVDTIYTVKADDPSPLDTILKETHTRIFYATRTHSQIAQVRVLDVSGDRILVQVIDELQRTKYKPKTTILAARRHCCVHPVVSRSSDVDRGCKNLLKTKGKSCQYFVNTQRMRAEKTWPITDIEDLAKSSKKKGICPYFLARKRLPGSELVLSPYNYLIQPSIRKSYSLELEGAGIIFDEGHNIDDFSREAASFETDLDSVNNSGILFQKKAQFYERRNLAIVNACSVLDKALEGLSKLLQEFMSDGSNPLNLQLSVQDLTLGRGKALKKVEYGKCEVIYESSMAMKLLEDAGVGSVHMVAIEEAMTVLDSIDEPKEEDLEDLEEAEGGVTSKEPDVSVGMALFGQLISALDMMYKGPSAFTEAYRLCIKRLQMSDQATSRRASITGERIELQLICLNAAVAFSQISQICRSVILTSGTLSPMSSFASELGIEFKFILESSHVIKMEKQVWAGVCSVDPRNLPITCTYNELQHEGLLDRIGGAILEWIGAVPDGVLVFMPSFRVLNLLIDRWMATGLHKKLGKVKKVFQEARGGTEDFEGLMKAYYRAIDSGKGALFLGVCRGKASEGINFTDGYARSVVIVGIPYPAIMDVKIKMKKDYNTKWASRLGLMSGNAWYNQQAFRALNQGIGRCIRHKNDFGAILLLDSRFANQERMSYVSRWVRSQARQFQSFDQSIASVREFYKQNEDLQALVRPPTILNQGKKRTSNRVKEPTTQGARLLQATLDVVHEPCGGLIGFAELLDETIGQDISSFSERLIQDGIFTDSEEDRKDATEAAKRCIVDCLNQALKSANDLEVYLADWLHCIPTGIAALFNLKGIKSKFTFDAEILTGRRISALPGIRSCLEELKELYMDRLQPLSEDIEEVSISTE